jgi:hypothetical protein
MTVGGVDAALRLAQQPEQAEARRLGRRHRGLARAARAGRWDRPQRGVRPAPRYCPRSSSECHRPVNLINKAGLPVLPARRDRLDSAGRRGGERRQESKSEAEQRRRPRFWRSRLALVLRSGLHF